jgi:hypothetical protein
MSVIPKVRVHAFTISLDGYGAGPDQSLKNPLGAGGEALHGWFVPTRTFQKYFAARRAARPAPTTISPRAASRTSARGSAEARV